MAGAGRQVARARLLDVPAEQPRPPWCCRSIRPRNYSTPTPETRPHASWSCWPRCFGTRPDSPALIVALTIRADRYEPLQIAPQLADLKAGHRGFRDDLARRRQGGAYSRTLEEVSSARTRIEHDFDPEQVRALKASASSDLSVGGPELAALALRAGLVDDCHLFLNPVAVGGGTPALPHGLRPGTGVGRPPTVRQWRGPPALPCPGGRHGAVRTTRPTARPSAR